MLVNSSWWKVVKTQAAWMKVKMWRQSQAGNQAPSDGSWFRKGCLIEGAMQAEGTWDVRQRQTYTVWPHLNVGSRSQQTSAHSKKQPTQIQASPGGASGEESASRRKRRKRRRRRKRHRLDPRVGKTPWRRKWQPTPVLSPGESHGQRSLLGYSPRGHKESDTTELA